MKCLSLIALGLTIAYGQLYEEHFTDGSPQLAWHPFFTDSTGAGDSMTVVYSSDTPETDGWAGSISNATMTVAGLTYAGEASLTDYSIEALIYTAAVGGDTGTYNGVALRADPETGSFYRFVSDFDSNERLRLAAVIGGMPQSIRDWTGSEIPGGPPAFSDWHKMKLKAVGNKLWAYFDDQELAGCPFTDDSLTAGYFGIYTFTMVKFDSTLCDGIIVRDETGSVAENPTLPINSSVKLYPNPFSSSITFQLTSPGQTEIKIYDCSGKVVKVFNHLTNYLFNQITWDGRDELNRPLPAGIYFYKLSADPTSPVGKITLIR